MIDTLNDDECIFFSLNFLSMNEYLRRDIPVGQPVGCPVNLSQALSGQWHCLSQRFPQKPFWQPEKQYPSETLQVSGLFSQWLHNWEQSCAKFNKLYPQRPGGQLKTSTSQKFNKWRSIALFFPSYGNISSTQWQISVFEVTSHSNNILFTVNNFIANVGVIWQSIFLITNGDPSSWQPLWNGV